MSQQLNRDGDKQTVLYDNHQSFCCNDNTQHFWTDSVIYTMLVTGFYSGPFAVR